MPGEILPKMLHKGMFGKLNGGRSQSRAESIRLARPSGCTSNM